MTIFNKTTDGNPDRTLILGHRESLIMPLPFVKWQRIKIGVIWSLTNTTENNYVYGDSSQENVLIPQDDVYSPEVQFWFGLKSNNDNFFPMRNGNYFYGSGNGAWVRPSSRSIGSLRFGTWFPNQTRIIYSNFDRLLFTDAASHDNNSNYAAFFGLDFLKQNETTLQILNRDNVYNLEPQDKTNEFWNQMSQNFSNAGINTYSLGFPSNSVLFLHWPFYRNRLRVHQIGAALLS